VFREVEGGGVVTVLGEIAEAVREEAVQRHRSMLQPAVVRSSDPRPAVLDVVRAVS
jgi:hypothetical protein